MASIKISELRPAGSELFQDSESFLHELNDGAMDHVLGGRGYGFVLTAFNTNYNTAANSYGNTANTNTITGINTKVFTWV